MTDAEKIKQAAEKIHMIFAPWDLENATEEETAEEIKKHPLDCILFLLEYME